ncbi:hypothetical protein H4V98_001505 [Polaromonas sp. CG_23.6]|nr:hypothetical protein [Polaromonas sp. CG_23.6]
MSLAALGERRLILIDIDRFMTSWEMGLVEKRVA